MRTSDDSIEIHWDERYRHLALACGPEAFETFRRVVREELRDFPEIPLDQVETVEISDTRTIVSRRESPRNYALTAVMVAGYFGIALPWGVGVGAIIRWLTR